MGNSCAVAAWQASVHSGNEQGAREARSGIVQSYHSSQVFHGGCSGLLIACAEFQIPHRLFYLGNYFFLGKIKKCLTTKEMR